MSSNKPLSGDSVFAPVQWIGRDGMPLQGDEKISMLNKNLAEIHELCQHTFADAMQAGCSEEFMRIVLRNMIDSLKRNSDRTYS